MMLKKTLSEYPDNKEIMSRIENCDEIIGRTDCLSLIQVYQDGKIGFADKDGYIVIDMLYDSELERKAQIIVLKINDNVCIVGGKLKTSTDSKYIDYEWLSDENCYMMKKNNDGDYDFIRVENQKLKIESL